jgi:hypothetical protein
MEASGLAHRGLAWLFILLAFVGFVLMLSGVSSLQQVRASAAQPSKGIDLPLPGHGRRCRFQLLTRRTP